ncbi:MAG: putative toxin-antitoxin system toxin component, PIN family [Selenomonadaceae bacterium]|nr:putative toxin-antitoxin system toxin component, PIN family [Selenomonadaceae bacterium]
MNVVLDTNILVSAALSPGRNASNILAGVVQGRFTACYDSRILEEYERVLHYPKFKLTSWEIYYVLSPVMEGGMRIMARPLPDVSFDRDETDRKFYEVARTCHGILITGNLAHYPSEPFIMSPGDFYRRYL